MKIRLEYVAMLKVHGSTSGSTIDVGDGCTVEGLLHHLGVTSGHQRAVTAFVNDDKVSHGRILTEGDRVFLSIPMSGG